MRRYLLFAMRKLRTDGGWDDFQGDFDTTTEALDHFEKGRRSRIRTRSWCDGHIVDTTTGKMVLGFDPEEGWIPYDTRARPPS